MNPNVKIFVLIFSLLSLDIVLAQSAVDIPVTEAQLDENCLACHREQRLPDNLIYRRYLMKYSSPKRIENALVGYLQHPAKERSIMPSEFFLRFPMKYTNKLSPQMLRDHVRAYIDHFDVRKRLRLQGAN